MRILVGGTKSLNQCRPETTIYGLKHPDKDGIRYVGRTNGRVNLKVADARVYINKKHRREKSKIATWIWRLFDEGIVPEIVVIEICNKNLANERHIYWVDRLRNEGPLLNPVSKEESVRKAPKYVVEHVKFAKLAAKNSGPVRQLGHAEIDKLYGTVHGVVQAMPERAVDTSESDYFKVWI